MHANVEKKYDEYEDKANEAMMFRHAQNAKRVKKSDLFKRPIDESKAEDKAEKMQEESEKASEWLSQFSLFDGKIS